MDEFSTGTMANEMHMLIRIKFNGICKNRTLPLGFLVSCISVESKTCRMVKKLMRLRAHSISGAPRAVRDTESGLDTLGLG
jgi:hypothetical protein